MIMQSCSSAWSKLSPPGPYQSRRNQKPLPCELRKSRCSSHPAFSEELLPAPNLSDVAIRKETKGRAWGQLFCDFLEHVVDRRFNRYPLHKSVDPELRLAGNFAPVDELPPTPCPIVKGTIPDCLRGGAYIRNGPNPRQRPRGPHHFFDGDGMLHSLLLPGGGDGRSHAVLCSRYSKTSAPVLRKTFGLRGSDGVARIVLSLMRILSGELNHAEGMGPANTSVSFFLDNIFVLGETDPPFRVYLSPEDGHLLRQKDVAGKLAIGMSVHPKQDRSTGELFAVRYGVVPPFLTYFCFDERGNKKLEVPIASVRRPSIFHDFAITQRYAILPETQLAMDPLGLVFCGGYFISCDTKKIPRVGVMPRDASSGSEIRWFDVPGFNPMHIWNGWEEGDDGGVVVLVGSNFVNVEHFVERPELVHSIMEMVRIDLRTSIVTRTPLSVMGLEFGGINPTYSGMKSRYAYAGITEPSMNCRGVVKLDLNLAEQNIDCVVGKREYEPGCFGGEPIFVPKEEGNSEEDDGYLLTFMHDEHEDRSKFIVMDARSPELEVVAEVELPRRVPYGFHGVFVSKGDLQRQRT